MPNTKQEEDLDDTVRVEPSEFLKTLNQALKEEIEAEEVEGELEDKLDQLVK